jgi:hypothetical protein
VLESEREAFLAEFTQVAGSGSTGFDPAQGKQALGVGQSVTLALVGGDGLLVAANDPSVVSVVEEPQLASNQRTFTLTGSKAGRTTVSAKDGTGGVQAMLQVEASLVSAAERYREIFRDFRITAEDRARLSPESIAALERGVQELVDNPPPDVEFVHPERFSDNVLVKEGETSPPNWGKKK